MNQQHGNGYSEDRRWVRETLDDHGRQLRGLNTKVWTLLLTFGAAVLAGVMAWAYPRAPDPVEARRDSIRELIHELETDREQARQFHDAGDRR